MISMLVQSTTVSQDGVDTVSFIGGNSRFLYKLHSVQPVNAAVALSSDSHTPHMLSAPGYLIFYICVSIVSIGLLGHALNLSGQ